MIPLPLLALLAAPPQVGPGGAVLREGCDQSSAGIAQLAPGTGVSIRFSMNGELGVCYKVQAAGRQGYLSAADLGGLDGFEQGRRSASPADSPSAPAAPRAAVRPAEAGIRLNGLASSTVREAMDLLDHHQPKQALRRLEWSLANEGRLNPLTLALAGLAAYQSDELARAAQYWRESLQIENNPSVARLLDRLTRESAADSGANVEHGERFRLRFDGGQIPAHIASAMLQALDAEYQRIDGQLGCGGNESITAIVLSRDAYKASSGGAEWSAAQYDGRIRVGMPDAAVVSPELRRRFAHEIVHACLARRGSFPSWFHEGLAQRYSGDRLTDGQKAEVRSALRDGRLPGLSALSGPWSGMSAAQARLAYDYALAAVETLAGDEGEDRIRDLIRNPASLTAAAARIVESLKR
ncbi:MAG: hypothetical protein C0504_10915 [Candidatus Solibacter sp.]|nr:hypothetical protein [Candidatus Solibacter sp.]